MKVKSIVTGFGLTKNKTYTVIYEYDSVYELECDDGKIYCRAKEFFETDDKKTICRGYCGIACVGRSCPVSLAEEYAELYGDVIKKCDDCPYYKGCEDCAFKDTGECVENRKE